MTNQEPIIDPEKWQSLVASLDETVVDVADSFLADTPNSLKEMKAAYSKGDMETVGRIAHSLKSSSAIFGATRLSKLSFALEQAVQNKEGGIEDKISEVGKVYLLVEKELKNNLDQAGFAQT